MSVRKSSRKTAGQLPSRFLSDETVSPSPPSSSPQRSRTNAASPSRIASKSSQAGITSSGEADYHQPSIKSKSIMPSRKQQPRNARSRYARETTLDSEKDADRRPMVYPAAAFPSLEFPARPSEDAQKDQEHPCVWDTDVGAYLENGRHQDQDGQRVHFIAEWIETNTSLHEESDIIDSGDVHSHGGRTRSDHRRVTIGAGKDGDKTKTHPKDTASLPQPSSPSIRDGVDDNDDDFEDKEFEALHPRLQICIIDEMEEDLRRRPPPATAHEEQREIATSPVRTQYLCRLLGIRETSTISAMRTRVERTRKDYQDPSRMPSRRDFVDAKTWVRAKELPDSLLEMYDYLDTSVFL